MQEVFSPETNELPRMVVGIVCLLLWLCALVLLKSLPSVRFVLVYLIGFTPLPWIGTAMVFNQLPFTNPLKVVDLIGLFAFSFVIVGINAYMLFMERAQN